MKKIHFALITLGANSFNLLIATSHRNELNVQKVYKRKVRLLENISFDGELHKSSLQRAQSCLAFFSECVQQYEA